MSSLPKPHLITAIDPGKHLCGCSTWLAMERGAVMVDARAVIGEWSMARALGDYMRHIRGNVEDTYGLGRLLGREPTHYIAIEVPQRYTGKRAKLSGVRALEAVIEAIDLDFGGLVVARHTPNEWKGQVPKPVHHRRVRAALKPGELAAIKTPDDHNTWDGVGYGCFITGRLGRGGAAP